MAGDDEQPRRRAGVLEAEARTRIDIEGPGRLGDVAPRRADAPPGRAPDAAPTPPGRLAGAAQTLRSVLGFGREAGRAAGHLGHLARAGLPRDVIDDAEARRRAGADEPDLVPTEGVERRPPRPETLPAVISTAMTRTGDARIVPRWHMVRHLPGYQMEAIRTLGRSVFAPLTDTPIEDIQTVSTLSNRSEEVKAMATWIFRNGIRDDEAEMDFARVMPGYAAKTQIWNVEGFTFMVVKDFAGHYIYAWPGGRGTRLGSDPEAPRLGRP